MEIIETAREGSSGLGSTMENISSIAIPDVDFNDNSTNSGNKPKKTLKEMVSKLRPDSKKAKQAIGTISNLAAGGEILDSAKGAAESTLNQLADGQEAQTNPNPLPGLGDLGEKNPHFEEIKGLNPKKAFKDAASKIRLEPDKVKNAASAFGTLVSSLQDASSDNFKRYSYTSANRKIQASTSSDVINSVQTLRENLKQDPPSDDVESGGQPSQNAKKALGTISNLAAGSEILDSAKGSAESTLNQVADGQEPQTNPNPLPGLDDLGEKNPHFEEIKGFNPKKKFKDAASKIRLEPDKVKNAASAFGTLVSSLQDASSASDVINSVQTLRENLKQDPTSDDVENGGQPSQNGNGFLGMFQPSKNGDDSDEDLDSEGEKKKKKCCTKLRVASIIFTLLSYAAILTLGYFNVQARLERGRNDLLTCAEIQRFPSLTPIRSGIYTMRDRDGTELQSYCDMETGGGGWTLVASIHDNNAGPGGHCTVGDRWSSTQGNSNTRPRGDGNWLNVNTFGSIVSATSDDYKSQSYFNIIADDIMIWQVPNDTPLREWRESSYLRYRTTDGFLREYGNLYWLYRNHFPLVSRNSSENGPSVEVLIDRGNISAIVPRFAPNIRDSLTPGFIQFRAVNQRGDAYALCPGVKFEQGTANVQSACIGSTGLNFWPETCGDFSGFYSTNSLWKASDKLISSTFLIFYR